MSERIGPWTVRARRRAYENKWIGVDHHEVTHPDGSAGVYGVVRYANLAIGVLPIFEDGTTLLVGQHRFPLDRYSWELPEGGGPRHGDPLASARRELAEETGYRAREWREFARFDISNSVTDEEGVCFLAWGLTPGAAAPEPSEALDVKRAPFAELLAQSLSGEISDALTLIMVLKAHALALRGAAPGPICDILAAKRGA